MAQVRKEVGQLAPIQLAELSVVGDRVGDGTGSRGSGGMAATLGRTTDKKSWVGGGR